MTACIKPEKNKQQDGETPEGRSAIAEKRQRYANYGYQPDCHSYVDQEMEEEDGKKAIGIYP